MAWQYFHHSTWLPILTTHCFSSSLVFKFSRSSKLTWWRFLHCSCRSLSHSPPNSSSAPLPSHLSWSMCFFHIFTVFSLSFLLLLSPHPSHLTLPLFLSSCRLFISSSAHDELRYKVMDACLCGTSLLIVFLSSSSFPLSSPPLTLPPASWVH